MKQLHYKSNVNDDRLREVSWRCIMWMR